MDKQHLHLQQTEVAIVQAAANLYAAYIRVGRIPIGDEEQWMERAVNESIQIAKMVDDNVISEGEVESK